MGVYTGNKRELFRGLDGTSSRDFVFYSNILISHGLISDGTTISHDACRQQVLNYLLMHEEKEREDQISWLNHKRNIYMLPREFFEWLENDERACCWAWGRLIIKPITPPVQSAFSFIENYKGFNETDFYSKPRIYPSNQKERLEAIIYFFDTTGYLLDFLTNTIETMKEAWATIYNNAHPLKFISPTNSEQCEWAWNYLNEHQMALSIFKPMNYSEKYLATVASLDLNDTHKDTKKLFTISMKKAWDQKKYRQKQEGKKPLNTYIRKETKAKLDWLSEQRGQNINKTIEWLIDKEYESHINAQGFWEERFK
ncbi:hypothetical protein QPM17_21230 [Marinobacter sp. TBZ242]|uniref:Uncharacterized protein n=1 Tax=Marinobacter azerbaijanicus TaxID=3050455 RepID=A0ABT7IHQ3_9GAMM|nr:hypothetical protein [Marinobacter sp. TBZ242]MDL0433671.1 hypothetical protein [Marinobacter sp. TBZ242]